MNNLTILAIDIAKNVFQLHGNDNRGNCLLKKRLSRSTLCSYISNLVPCTIVMEACGGSNYWARKFRDMGHEVKLISPQYVKPFVKTNKYPRGKQRGIKRVAIALHPVLTLDS
ncbi:hypothetical protein L3V83_15380 [Thiotrichales bacterium 19X7-9]|nr:hypothetical protein [Thiotrichales bacterium 19X7-9]